MTMPGRRFSPWLAGLALAGAAHASVVVTLTGRDLPAPAAAPKGAFVVELAEFATSRNSEPREVALGEEAQAQEAIAPSTPETPRPPPDESQSLHDETPPPEESQPEQPAPKNPAVAPQPEVAQNTTTHSDAAVLADKDRAKEQAPQQKATDPQKVAAWLRALEMALQKHKSYPESARQRREEGVASVHLTLDASGGFLQARLLKGSGSQSLDAAALTLVEQAAPYPPPPAIGATKRLTLVVPVRYALD